MSKEDQGYYERRVAQERAAAAEASDASVANIHLALAEQYGELARAALDARLAVDFAKPTETYAAAEPENAGAGSERP